MTADDAATVDIEPLQPADWGSVAAIYREGIETRNATFETEVPSWEAWSAAHLPSCRLVARTAGAPGILGWGALSPVSGRCVYAGVAEVSLYVAADARGRGVGRQLLQALIAASEREGIWSLHAGIFPENAASIALHLACGFRHVGVHERLGQMDGQWRDIMLLERRSEVVGV